MRSTPSRASAQTLSRRPTVTAGCRSLPGATTPGSRGTRTMPTGAASPTTSSRSPPCAMRPPGSAWERLARRVQSGDLQAWMRDVDELRHDVTGTLQMPLAWSPMQEVNLGTVPTDGSGHAHLVHGGHHVAVRRQAGDYIDACGAVYSKDVTGRTGPVPEVGRPAAGRPRRVWWLWCRCGRRDARVARRASRRR